MDRLRIVIIATVVASYSVLYSSIVLGAEKVVVAGLYLPPFMIEENQTDEGYRGIVIELVEEAFKRVGKQVEFQMSNWPRSLFNAKHGNANGLIPASKNEARISFFHFHKTPIVMTRMVLVKQKGGNIKFDGNMNSLSDYLIVKVNNALVTPEFDEAIENNTINVANRNNYELSLKAVAYGRADLAVIAHKIAVWLMQRLTLDHKLQIVEPMLGEIPIYVAFSKKNTDLQLVKDFDLALLEMHTDGTFGRIIHKYFGDSVDANTLSKSILAIRQKDATDK